MRKMVEMVFTQNNINTMPPCSYLAKNIHGALSSALSQKLNPKFQHPTLGVFLSICLGYCPNNLAWAHRRVFTWRKTNSPSVIIEQSGARRLWCCATSPIRLHLVPLVSINTVAVTFTATWIIALAIWIRSQIGLTTVVATIPII